MNDKLSRIDDAIAGITDPQARKQARFGLSLVELFTLVLPHIYLLAAPFWLMGYAAAANSPAAALCLSMAAVCAGLGIFGLWKGSR